MLDNQVKRNQDMCEMEDILDQTSINFWISRSWRDHEESEKKTIVNNKVEYYWF